MLVEKKKFSVDSFYFENADVSIPMEIGYEAWGELNEAKDNAILVCHYYTGTGHAAGKYSEEDEAPGWWDSIIGPGKPLDTDRFFVICSDVISNMNHFNPNVITTGPASINPKTGREYAMDFPIFTIKDMVNLQKQLIDSLRIKKLHTVIGPSMGGLQSYTWAKYYPEMVGRIVAVDITPVMRPYGIMIPNQMGIYAIMLDPKWNNGNYYGREIPRDGLLLAFKCLFLPTRTEQWFNDNYGREFADPDKSPFDSFDNWFKVEQGIHDIVAGRMANFDANAYLYIAKANSLFDLREGEETQEEAVGRIKTPTLVIIDESDLLFDPNQAEQTVKFIPDSELFYYNSGNGHLSCLFETHYFAGKLREFINRDVKKPANV